MTIEKLFILLALLSAIITWFTDRERNYHFAIRFLQSFMGLLFMFSGIVKAIDPLGTAYKMKDYFESFAHDGLRGFWEGLSHYSVLFSIAMITFEIVLGLAIFIGWKRRWSTVGLLGLNLFFLFLTGYSYLSGFCLTNTTTIIAFIILFLIFVAAMLPNPMVRKSSLIVLSISLLLLYVFCMIFGSCTACEFTVSKMKVTDCGCFGDFMKLKPQVTFYKDIFLTIISIILVMYYTQLLPLFDKKTNRVIMTVGLFLSMTFCVYSTYYGEPIVDFRPYKIGNDINKEMQEVKPSIIENILVYKNTATGDTQDFTINNIPTTDDWTYVDRRDKVIQEGIPAPIHNLIFQDVEGNNITESLLHDPQVTYWVIIYNANKSNMEAFKDKIVPFYKKMREKNVNVYIMTGSSNAQLDQMIKENQMDQVIADETALKTMIRSNPGIMKVQNGVVLNKWHYLRFTADTE